MSTQNRGVMVYLPSELEAKIAEYCTEYNITRRDKQGNLATSLGSGIVAYLKSQLLGDLPRTVSNRPVNGLTKEEVLDLIAESSVSNTQIVGVDALAENRSPDLPDTAVVYRLEAIEQKLSSSMGMERDEVEQLLQASEQKIMAAVRSMSIELQRELTEVKTTDEQINTSPVAISTTDQEKAIEGAVKSPVTQIDSVVAMSDNQPLSKDIKRWLEPLKDKKFRDIVQAAISGGLSNKEIVTSLFAQGYGKNENTETYPPNLASAMKTALRFWNYQCA